MSSNFDRAWIIPAAHILSSLSNRLSLRKQLWDWMGAHKEEMPLSKPLAKMVYERDHDLAADPRIWRRLIGAFKTASLKLEWAETSVLHLNLGTVKEMFNLNEVEFAVLEMAALYACHEPFEGLLDILSGSDQPMSKTLAAATGLSHRAIESVLNPEGRLMRGGLLEIEHRLHKHGRLEIAPRLVRCLESNILNADGLAKVLLGRPCRTELHWEDFDHLEPQRTLVERILTGAVEQRCAGVNILLYGPPGTGKSSFCQALAAKLGMDVYAVGESDEDGGEPTRSERLSSLRMMQFLLANQSRSLLLVDEMEDVFDQGYRLEAHSGFSRAHTHRVLESNATPTLWTCNHIDRFEQSLLRRFTLAIEVPQPGLAVRARVLTRLLSDAGLPLPDEAVSGLAADFQSPPAVIASAVNATHLAQGGEPELRHILRLSTKALAYGQEEAPRKAESSVPFLPTLCRCDEDLETLTKRCVSAPSSRLSFCLYGASGTGKSAFARHLAGRMGLEVIHKRASDLLDMYVGGSEKQIARAFAEARQAKAMLIFDEADSLLADRRHAHRNWEVSQVNEMLTWMESHPYPFVCTTNLMEHLDQACLRRFTFKVRFDALGEEDLCQAFHAFFTLAAPHRLRAIKNLTPGDFALVRFKAQVLGLLDDPSALADLLEQEAASKGDQHRRQVGFRSKVG